MYAVIIVLLSPHFLIIPPPAVFLILALTMELVIMDPDLSEVLALFPLLLLPFLLIPLLGKLQVP